MSAGSGSGGVSDTGGGIFAGLSSSSTDNSDAWPQPRGRSAPLSEEAWTVELAFGADAGTTESQSRAEPEAGIVLGCRYLLEEVIGRGGTSSVFRAKDLRPERSANTTTNLVAVKVSRRTQRNEPVGRIRLQREFHAMSGLSHAGIARVYELDCDGGMWFMSMQLISGQTLKAWMATGRAQAEALKIIDSCCEALEYSHSMGIIHGDLKPTNILVTEGGTAKLIDFGSASIPGTRASLGSDPTVSTTPLYASPQILAGERAEPRDDVFSLACLSYGILSGGRHPYGGHPSFEAFRAKSAPTYSPAIPVELFAVIERGLSVERDRRPASVSEFRRQFGAAEHHRRAKAGLVQPAKSNPIQKISAEPPILPPTLAGIAPIIAPSARKRGGSWGLKRGQRLAASLAVLMVAGAAVVVPHTESAVSKRPGANRLTDARLDAPHSAAIPLQASSAGLVPIPERAPLPSAKAAPMRHDSSSISFNAAIVHASARQSLVAIAVRRSPANETPGEFVWRVERGNAVPSIDYERIGPRRVSFIEGQTLRTLFIPLLNRATSRVPSGPRFFDVVLRPVAGGPSLGRIARITVVIDPASTVWIAKSEPPSGVLR